MCFLKNFQEVKRMDFKEILKGSNYDFLRKEFDLGRNLILLTLGGSYAYGTNIEGSDIDFRGIAHNRISDLLGTALNPFEQYVEVKTDTTIYSLNKIVKLLLSCNPNTVEILGCNPKHYIFVTDVGKQILENKGMFLSKKAIASFGGYAGQQLNRMLNALARDAYEQKEREEHILRSLKSAMNSFNERYSDFGGGYVNLFIGPSEKEDIESEIKADISLKNYPLRDFNGMLNELGSISRTYNKCNHRNNKKDDTHLNKHAMHLVRLFLMGIDILEKGEIITYREKEHDLLMKIRNGYFQKKDHTYVSEFFELVDELQKRFEYAANNTNLPDVPDYKRVNELLFDINIKKIKEESI